MLISCNERGSSKERSMLGHAVLIGKRLSILYNLFSRMLFQRVVDDVNCGRPTFLSNGVIVREAIALNVKLIGLEVLFSHIRHV